MTLSRTRPIQDRPPSQVSPMGLPIASEALQKRSIETIDPRPMNPDKSAQTKRSAKPGLIKNDQ